MAPDSRFSLLRCINFRFHRQNGTKKRAPFDHRTLAKILTAALRPNREQIQNLSDDVSRPVAEASPPAGRRPRFRKNDRGRGGGKVLERPKPPVLVLPPGPGSRKARGRKKGGGRGVDGLSGRVADFSVVRRRSASLHLLPRSRGLTPAPPPPFRIATGRARGPANASSGRPENSVAFVDAERGMPSSTKENQQLKKKKQKKTKRKMNKK